MPQKFQVGYLVICKSNRARGRRGRILEISRENHLPRFRVDFGPLGEMWMYQRAFTRDRVGGVVGEVVAGYDEDAGRQRPRNLAVELNPPGPLLAENSDHDDEPVEEPDLREDE
jgi:hypothetical protein